MAMKKLPDFANEAEEAQWYAEHQDELDAYFGKARKPPVPLHLQLGLPPMQEAVAAAPKSPSTAIKLRVSAKDLASAKLQAESKGIGYQTYLKMLIHEGLERNAGGMAKTS